MPQRKAPKRQIHPIERKERDADHTPPFIKTVDNVEKIIGDSQFFRYELIASLLINKPIEIQLQRQISPSEINFLRFIDRMTEGTKLEVSPDAKSVKVHPGVIVGGIFTHKCVPERGISFWVEAASLLCPFAKNPSEITFTSCVTNCTRDIGYDLLRTVTVPLLRRFGINSAIQLKKRYCLADQSTTEEEPDGCVIFTIDNVRVLEELRPLQRGFIKRVRGVAFGVRVAPDLCNQLATSAKGCLLKILADVYVLTDVDNKRANIGEKDSKTGYGICLLTESTTKNAVCSAEAIARPRESPEDLASRCVNDLLQEVKFGGVIDRRHQALAIYLMGLAVDLPSVAHLGTELTASARYLIQHLMPNIFHVKYMKRNRVDETSADYTELTCIGSRLVNVFKKST